jgi:glycosyltransferase involved in cell wall biosynthesis
MGAPLPDDPRYQFPPRGPLPPGGPVRVVEVLATGTAGGAQEHVYSLLSRIDRSRYIPSVVSLSPGAAARRIAGLGIPVLVIDEPDDAVAVGALTAHLVDLRPEVLHNHMYRAELVGTRAAIALGAIGMRRPYVISTVHSSRVREPEDREELRRLTPQMDRLVAVSRAMVEKIRDEGRVGAPVDLVYNGVDLHRYDHQEPCCTLREEYGMPPEASIVGVVARLEHEKGHRTLLEAWPRVLARVPDAYLLIVGEGHLRAELQRLADELGVASRVIFVGRRDDIPAVTAALDVAVLPSYREAQGIVVLEAMALSRPIVATRVGGIPEMIEDGVSGLLVPPHDAVALADAITRLLLDHPLADTIARRGHDVVHDRFSVEFMVRAVEDLYDEGARVVRLRDAVAV